RDDIHLRQRAPGCAELGAQVVEEARVDVDRLIGRAVERAGRARRVAASGARRTREQNELGGRTVGDALLDERGRPVRVERRGRTLHAAFDARVRVGARLALFEAVDRTRLVLAGAAAEETGESR